MLAVSEKMNLSAFVIEFGRRLSKIAKSEIIPREKQSFLKLQIYIFSKKKSYTPSLGDTVEGSKDI